MSGLQCDITACFAPGAMLNAALVTSHGSTTNKAFPCTHQLTSSMRLDKVKALLYNSSI